MSRVPSVAFTRIWMMITIPLAVVFGVEAISHALTLKTWSSGDTLTAAELNANFQAIENELAPPPWTAATLATGWTNFPDAQYDGAGYRKIGNRVFLRGVLSGTDFAATNVITTLPTGYRPPKRKIFPAPCKANVMCRIDVLADGKVLVQADTGAGFATLDPISFSVD
jgi:hypothetical protein